MVKFRVKTVYFRHIGDYVKVIKNPYKGYYATVTDSSANEEIEINYFQRKGKYWKLKKYDLDSKTPDKIELVSLSQVVLSKCRRVSRNY